MSYTSLDQLKEELSVLVFARVSTVVLKEQHKQKSHTSDDENAYDHYFGFAKIETGANVEGSVWFKRATHLSRNGGFFFGPVSHVPPYTKACEIPKRGDAIVGKIIKTKKGNAYVWWTHHATPFMNFRSFVHFPKKLSNEPRAFSMLKLVHTRNKTSDDLYVLAQVLLKHNVDLLVSQMKEESEQPRHPWLKDASGYQRKKGFDCEYHPVEFAYFASLFMKSSTIYKRFIEKISPTVVVDYPEDLLNRYTVDRLEKHIESVSKIQKVL
jgi:hypothetical protein